MNAMASDNLWSMSSIALYRRIDIYLFVLYIICRFIKKIWSYLQVVAFSFISIIAMNCYLRWLKKTGEFCFAMQLFTTVFKKQAFWFGTFFPSTGKDWGSQMTIKLLIRVTGLYSSSQMKHTRHWPVNLWPWKQIVNCSCHSRCVDQAKIFPVFRLRSTLLCSHMRSAHVLYFFLLHSVYSSNLAFASSNRQFAFLAFLLSWQCRWWRNSLFTTVYFFFYKLLWIQRLRSATFLFLEVISVVFCSMSADYLAALGGEKSFFMCSKKAFSFSLNSPGQSSGFAQSERSSYSFLVF